MEARERQETEPRIEKRRIEVGDGSTVSSVWAIPPDYGRAGRRDALILAHGAGTDMHSPFMNFMHEGLAAHGFLSVKFNFPYKERGGKAPDRAPLLEAAWRAVAVAVRNDPLLAPERCFLGGKSMGGRLASHLAAAGEPCAGLFFLGYPLHPPGRPERLRAAHLASIACPMLFIQGTRDSLCNMDLLREVLARLLAPVTLHQVQGGDHAFGVPKRSGRAPEEVWAEIVETVAGWARALRPR